MSSNKETDPAGPTQPSPNTKEERPFKPGRLTLEEIEALRKDKQQLTKKCMDMPMPDRTEAKEDRPFKLGPLTPEEIEALREDKREIHRRCMEIPISEWSTAKKKPQK